MIFKLFVNKQTIPQIIYYDNINNCFYDDKKQPMLQQYSDIKETLDTPYFDQNNTPFNFDNHVELMEISLGANCNFDCWYCSQKTFKDSVYSGSPKDVDCFIDMLKRADIQCKSVQLWGGEPLVYWKTIEKLVPKLRELYGDISISFPTNGSLLTRDKIDFCKKWNIGFWISHDGCENTKREFGGHQDVLINETSRDAIDYAMQVIPNKISFKTTFTHGNCDNVKIIKFFKKQFGDKVHVSTSNVVNCHDITNSVSVESSRLSQQDKDTITNSIFDTCHKYRSEFADNDISVNRRVDELVHNFVTKFPANGQGCECGLPFTNGSIVVNLRGDLVVCHNFKPYEPRINITKMKQYKKLGYHHWKSRDTNCKNCIALVSCHGGCPAIDNKAHLINCENLFALHYGMFKAAVAGLLGCYITKFESCNTDDINEVQAECSIQ